MLFLMSILKLEPPNVDHTVPNTVINQWEELTFDYSSDIGITSATLTIIPDVLSNSKNIWKHELF